MQIINVLKTDEKFIRLFSGHNFAHYLFCYIHAEKVNLQNYSFYNGNLTSKKIDIT